MHSQPSATIDKICYLVSSRLVLLLVLGHADLVLRRDVAADGLPVADHLRPANLAGVVRLLHRDVVLPRAHRLVQLLKVRLDVLRRPELLLRDDKINDRFFFNIS